MCRIAGRRCPHQNSNDYKKNAAARRRNNRKSKNQLKEYFEKKGLTETAEKIDTISPNLIPEILEKSGLSSDILDSVPHVTPGYEYDDDPYAEEIVNMAAKESLEKNKKIGFFNNEEDLENISDNLSQEMVNLFYAKDEQEKNSIEENLDKYFENIENINFSDMQWHQIIMKTQEKMNHLYYGEDFVSDVEKLINNLKSQESLDYDDIDNLEDKILTDKQYNEIENHIEQYNQSGMRDFINALMYEPEKLYTHKHLGNGFYIAEYDKMNVDSSEFLVYFAPKGVENMDLNENFMFSTPDILSKNITMSMGFNGVEKSMINEIVFSGGLRASAFFRKNNPSSEKVTKNRIYLSSSDRPLVDEKLIKTIAITKNIQNKRTYLDRMNIGEIALHGKTNREKTQHFMAGLSKTNRRNMRRVKQIQNNKEYIEQKENAINGVLLQKGNIKKETSYDGRFLGSKKEREDWKELTHQLYDYSGGNYSSYAYKAHGFHDIRGLTTDKSLDTMNKELIRFGNKSNRRERTLFRAFSAPKGMTAKEYIDTFDVGEIIATNKITSTTMQPEVLEEFGNNGKNGAKTLFVYNSKKGIMIDSISKFKEKEVVLPIGQKMVVVDKEIDKKGNAIIFLADNE